MVVVTIFLVLINQRSFFFSPNAGGREKGCASACLSSEAVRGREAVLREGADVRQCGGLVPILRAYQKYF